MRAGWRYCVQFALVPSSTSSISSRHCGVSLLGVMDRSSSLHGGSTNAAVLFRRASTHRTGDDDMKETAPLTGARPFSPTVVRGSWSVYE